MRQSHQKSIAFKIFKRRLTAEIRSYWYSYSSIIYAERWWKDGNKIQPNDRITSYPGDTDHSVFSRIDLKLCDYLSEKNNTLWSIRGNTITNIVTAFETYLYYQTKRGIYIDPTIINKSDISITAGELADSFENENQKDWLAEKIVSKYIRNNSHKKMIKKIDNLIQGGLINGQNSLIDKWTQKVTLRNALIHNSKLINVELTNIWPQKFQTIGTPINLDDGMIISTHANAYNLAEKIDQQFNRTIIGLEDAKLLARVAYLHNKELTNGDIANIVYKILNVPFTKNHAESAIAYQKKTRARIADFTIIEELIIEFLASVE